MDHPPKKDKTHNSKLTEQNLVLANHGKLVTQDK